MGRAENRKHKKGVKRKLTPEQYNQLTTNITNDLVEEEMKKRVEYFQTLFTEVMEYAMKKNKISDKKYAEILQDMEIEMLRRAHNGKS